MNGLIYDIQECSIYEGEGLRIAIFMKGCNLRCKWCHSPESQITEIQTYTDKIGNIRTIGRIWSSEKLSEYMNSMYRKFGIGFTFTGGDPIVQSKFLIETFDKVDNRVDIIIETSCVGNIYDLVVLSRRCSSINIGLKLFDEKLSELIGISPKVQLDNIKRFDGLTSVSYNIVIPLINGLTNGERYMTQLYSLTEELKMLKQVIFLPYNELTRAKYDMIGRDFTFESEKEIK